MHVRPAHLMHNRMDCLKLIKLEPRVIYLGINVKFSSILTRLS